jgi:hypothetical protein
MSVVDPAQTIDLSGMWIPLLARPPLFGARRKNKDDAEARSATRV